MLRNMFKKNRKEKVTPGTYTMKLKYRDTVTGEVFEVDFTSENFDMIMSKRTNQLIIG